MISYWSIFLKKKSNLSNIEKLIFFQTEKNNVALFPFY
jgi:hypothetical protein